jgi:hypothetical protein
MMQLLGVGSFIVLADCGDSGSDGSDVLAQTSSTTTSSGPMSGPSTEESTGQSPNPADMGSGSSGVGESDSGGAASSSSASMGATEPSGGPSGESEGSTEPSEPEVFALSSPRLTDGGMFEPEFTCEATEPNSQQPPLVWTAGPEGTLSYAIVFQDITLTGATPPNQNGYHSAIWDIPASVLSLPEGLPPGSPPMGIAELAAAKQHKNSPGEGAYLGPCPNFPGMTRANTDTYTFTLYALPVETLSGNVSNVQNIIASIEAAGPLAMAVLTGTSNAANNVLK